MRSFRFAIFVAAACLVVAGCGPAGLTEPEPSGQTGQARFALGEPKVYGPFGNGSVADGRAMRDDGQGGDLVANDGVWALAADFVSGPVYYKISVNGVDEAGAVTAVGGSALVARTAGGTVTFRYDSRPTTGLWPAPSASDSVTEAETFVAVGNWQAMVGDSNWSPNSSITVVHDDGKSGDRVAGDGIYTYRFAPTADVAGGQLKFARKGASWTTKFGSNGFSYDGTTPDSANWIFDAKKGQVVTAELDLRHGRMRVRVAPAKLLLTEVAADGAEFVELFNPNEFAVDLGDYYLSDNAGYFQVVLTAGQDSMTALSDFVMRFPDAAAVPAHGYYVVSVGPGTTFATAYGVQPDAELRNSSGTPAIADMRLPANWSTACATAPTLTNGGEPVVLFYWDNVSDLVTDVDYVFFLPKTATAEPSGNNGPVDKTGIVMDGPDADPVGTAYAAELATILGRQAVIGSAPLACIRRDFAETGQDDADGNGIFGADETTENWTHTWAQRLRPATPGAEDLFLASLNIAFPASFTCPSTSCLVGTAGSAYTLAVDASPVTLVLSALDQHGAAIAPVGTQVWTSTNVAVATVAGGVLTVKAPGITTLTFAAEGVVSNAITITVEARVPATAALALTSTCPSTSCLVASPGYVLATGSSATFQGTATDQFGNPITPAVYTYASVAPDVAAFTGAVLTAAKQGSTGVSYSAGAATSPTIPVEVQDRKAASITIGSVPAGNQINDGASAVLTTVTIDQFGAVLPVTVAWASTAPTFLAVASDGTLTAHKPTAAPVTISATVQGTAVKDTVDITVVPYPVLAALALTPPTATVDEGKTQAFAASCKDQYGGTIACGTLAWSSSDTAVATVNGSGVATGVDPGKATITAKNGSVEGTAELTVKMVPVITTVTVTPAQATIAFGGTQQFTATCYDQVGGLMACGTLTWASSATGVATVSSGGLASAAGAGGTDISAKASNGVTGVAKLTVLEAPAVSTVTLTPASATIAWQATQTFSATCHDQYGDSIACGTLTWSTDHAAVATVAGGVATGTGPGSTQIRAATANGKSGAASITVTFSATVTTVEVSPATATIFMGKTQQFAAACKDQRGDAMTCTTLAWTSSDTATASVNPTTGLASGLAGGQATIRAAAGNVSGTATLKVNDACAGVTCTASNECHFAGTCIDHETGACSSPLKTDLTPCTMGVCIAGACVPMPPDAGAPGADAATAGPDAEIAGIDAATPGRDASAAGADAAAVQADAGAAQQDASVILVEDASGAGPDATAAVLEDATVVGADAAEVAADAELIFNTDAAFAGEDAAGEEPSDASAVKRDAAVVAKPDAGATEVAAGCSCGSARSGVSGTALLGLCLLGALRRRR